MDTSSTGNSLVKCQQGVAPGGGYKDYVKGGSGNERRSVGTYCMLRSYIRGYLYLMLAKATLGPVLALLMMMAGIRTLTSIAGAEVDVSAISRFV
jgi:hypothetical protein